MVLKSVSTLALAVAVALGASAAHAGGDSAKGKKVFKKCAACHSLEAGKRKVGPSLHGIMGRTPGTLEGFKFSKAMIAYGESGKVWDVVTLSAFLEAPKKEVPKTRMAFPGVRKAEDRDNLIAYIEDATK